MKIIISNIVRECCKTEHFSVSKQTKSEKKIRTCHEKNEPDTCSTTDGQSKESFSVSILRALMEADKFKKERSCAEVETCWFCCVTGTMRDNLAAAGTFSRRTNSFPMASC